MTDNPKPTPSTLRAWRRDVRMLAIRSGRSGEPGQHEELTVRALGSRFSTHQVLSVTTKGAKPLADETGTILSLTRKRLQTTLSLETGVVMRNQDEDPASSVTSSPLGSELRGLAQAPTEEDFRHSLNLMNEAKQHTTVGFGNPRRERQ